jgi:pimeloyl-ACP methyl ester carboxylesterase
MSGAQKLEHILEDIDLVSRKVKVCGLNIHFKTAGRGTPVILLHGGGNDWHEWERNLAFIARDFQVFAPDMPGFGLSEPPHHVIDRSWSLVFLRNFMEGLGIKRADLIGHSMGALISLAFTAHYPESVRKLAIVDSMGLGKLSLKGRMLLVMFQVVNRCQKKKRGPKYLISPIKEWRIVDELPKIASPVLIVWGENDIYMPVAQSRLAANLIPGSRLYIFPHCRHAPQRENPAKFNSLILQFLKRQNGVS